MNGNRKKRRKGKRLRHGFTTGSAAAAAVKAALMALLTGGETPTEMDIPLPDDGRLTVPVESVEIHGDHARATVIKDAGDDPDATNRARISCTVCLMNGPGKGSVEIRGGQGVGMVTKPGLPVPPGEPAINPGPRKQLQKAVRECFLSAKAEQTGVMICIEVADGERIARKTLNPRLGIVGGISILGTRGTVIPFSHKAYEDTITMSMDVARAQGAKIIVLSTGGRSERLAKKLNPELEDSCFIQVADFFAFSLKEAAKRGFEHIIYSCFFGKLVKMAQGYPYTHAKKASIDFAALAEWCGSCGMEEKDLRIIRGANTARQALEIICKSKVGYRITGRIIGEAISNARRFAGEGPRITYCLFSMEGELLAEMNDSRNSRVSP